MADKKPAKKPAKKPDDEVPMLTVVDGVNVTATFNRATEQWEPVRTGDRVPVGHPLAEDHPEWFTEG